jgi:3-methyl-2-oxobutanoate hydroxymethyltransferase
MSFFSKNDSRKTIRDIAQHKGTTPLVVLTAYTTPLAKILDPFVDILLVGDSLGMVLYGLPTTLGVTLDMMIAHGQAVMRGSERAAVVIDMPFGSYQESPQQAYRNAVKILQETGAMAVKIEGGSEMADTISFLTERGIAVMGHIGLKPQYIHGDGGYRAQGKTDREALKIKNDAQHLVKAGIFSLVIEGTYESIARDITENISIPTIGIGASLACDGQVLVSDDMLGLTGEFSPKFVKTYADLKDTIAKAVSDYANDVRTRAFPSVEHCYGMGSKKS